MSASALREDAFWNSGMYEMTLFARKLADEWGSVVERRFTVGRATLAVFGDVWNLLNRQNIGWIIGWNSQTGGEFEYQMPRTPFVGMGVLF
jgi:hypothetical protein